MRVVREGNNLNGRVRDNKKEAGERVTDSWWRCTRESGDKVDGQQQGKHKMDK